MKIKLLLFLFTIPLVQNVFSQTDSNLLRLNLGFENVNHDEQMPEAWRICGQGYSVSIDSTIKHSGKYSLMIASGETKAEYDYGCVANFLPATYEGNEMELRVYIKFSDVKNDPVDLMLRMDGETDMISYANLQEQNITGTADWTLYTLKLSIPDKALKINIFPILTGEGKIWMDDLQILIDGKDISEAKTKPLYQSPAAKDHAFDLGSGITSVKVSPSKLTELVLLGRIWGFLKYYHPQVAEGNYNWDYELFRIMPKVLASKTIYETKTIISLWINGLGKFEMDSLAFNPQNVKLMPDLAWINKQDLGPYLYSQLIDIQYAKRTGDHYYIRLDEYVKNPVFLHENQYPGMVFPDAGFRMLALFRYWNIIQYYSPNRHLVTGGWEKVLQEYIPKMAAVKDSLAYRLTLLSLIARLSDTHANIWQDSVLDTYHGLNCTPIKIVFIGNSAVVEDFDQEWVGKSGLKKGDIIETVDNRPVSEIIKARLPYTPASNYVTQLRRISETMVQTNDTVMRIGYKRNGKLFQARLGCYPADPSHIHYKFTKQDTCYKLLPGNIAYVYPGTIKSEYLPEIMKSAAGTKGMIIDLRCYPSDFIVYSLGEYFMPQKTCFSVFSSGSLIHPGLFTIPDTGFVGSENLDFYKGKIIILVNEYTVSQAEFTAMAFRRAPGAMVIGSTTAGADGDVSGFYLPGDIYTQISGIGVYYPDGKETQRVGIIPDLVVKPTVAGIANGKDELLDKAIQIIQQ